MDSWRVSIKTVFVLALLALVPAAGARADSVENGSVQLKLNAALAKKLKGEEVRLTGLKPATAGRVAVTLPITNGILDPQYGSGYLFLGGGFKLQAGKRVATVRRLLLNTGERFLTGVVNGTTLKLASLPPQQAATDSFNLEVTVSSLPLTQRAASIFNRRLGLHGVFKAGRSLGSAAAKTRFETLTVRGGQIDIGIDGGFREKLQAVGAEASSSPSRVQAGQFRSDLSSGFIQGEEGLGFSQHDEPFDRSINFLTMTLSFESHTISGQTNVSANPQRGPFSGSLATFPPSTVQLNAGTGELSVSSLPLALDANLADLLNEVFAAPKGQPGLFVAGEAFGTASFAAPTR